MSRQIRRGFFTISTSVKDFFDIIVMFDYVNILEGSGGEQKQ